MCIKSKEQKGGLNKVMSTGESEILLESGTGELEVLKFKVNGVFYAINVIKVQEIMEIDYENVEPLPSQPPAVKGVTNVRDGAVTVIDLRKYLESTRRAGTEQAANDREEDYMILTEFNKTRTLFAVDKVIEIERIKWSDIEEPNQLMGELVNGVIKLEDQLVNFLDFEKILSDLRPEISVSPSNVDDYEADPNLREKREEMKLALVEDSPTIRDVLKGVLKEAGYTDLEIFRDGQQFWDHLQEIKKEAGTEGDIIEHIQVLIADIEMPQLDGHTLIRQIKDDEYFKELPVMIFSSLITDNLRHKGEEVGADAQVSKPEIDQLVIKLDELVLEN